MADRLASAFSPFDVLAITLAGAFVITGAWWGVDGVPAKAPSAAGAVGLVAASYVAGHLVGAASALLGFRELDPANHPWTRSFRAALGDEPARKADDGPARNGDIGPQPPSSFWRRLLAATNLRTAEQAAATRTDLRLRDAFADIRDLPVPDQVELIRSVLRQRKLDLRFETMNTNAWVLRSLATASGFLALFFVGLAVVDVVGLGVIDGGAGRLLPTAGGMAIATGAFELRARGYQRRSAATLKFEALALARPPAALRPPATSEEAAASQAGESAEAN